MNTKKMSDNSEHGIVAPIPVEGGLGWRKRLENISRRHTTSAPLFPLSERFPSEHRHSDGKSPIFQQNLFIHLLEFKKYEGITHFLV